MKIYSITFSIMSYKISIPHSQNIKPFIIIVKFCNIINVKLTRDVSLNPLPEPRVSFISIFYEIVLLFQKFRRKKFLLHFQLFFVSHSTQKKKLQFSYFISLSLSIFLCLQKTFIKINSKNPKKSTNKKIHGCFRDNSTFKWNTTTNCRGCSSSHRGQFESRCASCCSSSCHYHCHNCDLYFT